MPRAHTQLIKITLCDSGVKHKYDSLKSNKKSKTNWKKIDALKDSKIDYSDIPKLSEAFFKHAKLRMPHLQSDIQ